jgi:DNA replication protein DnaC
MAQNLLIEHHLKRLKLPAMVRQYQKLAQEATQQNRSYQDYLLSLLELEVAQREENQQKRRIAQAHFPYLRTLDQFEFSAIPSLNHTRVLELAKGEYLSRQENIILVGNMGTCPSGPAPSP